VVWEIDEVMWLPSHAHSIKTYLHCIKCTRWWVINPTC